MAGSEDCKTEVLIPSSDDASKDAEDKMHTEPSEAPDGGWGWLVLLGSFLTHVVADGIAYSFGIFYVELLDAFQSTKSATSLVASLMVGVSFLSGPLASALVNRFNCRVTTIVGAVTSASGFVISIWAPNIYFLYFSFGIVAGVGFGFLIHPAVVIVGQYFDRKRSLATGIAISGSGVGTFLLPPIIQALIKAYSWQGASLILSGLLLNLTICGGLYRPLKSRNRDTDQQRAPINNTDNGDIQNTENISINTAQIISHTDEDNTNHNCCSSLREELTLMTNFGLLKDIPFLLFAFSGTFTSVGFNAPYIFIPHHAKLHGITEQDASFLVSVAGVSNIFGRVVLGFTGDRLRSRRLYLFSTALVVTGMSTALVPLCYKYWMMASYMALFGFSVGGVVALAWVLLPDLLGVENLASALGLCMLFDGLTTPAGAPFLGWIFDQTASYNASFVVGGTMIVMSGLITYTLPCIRSRRWTTTLQSRTAQREVGEGRDR